MGGGKKGNPTVRGAFTGENLAGAIQDEDYFEQEATPTAPAPEFITEGTQTTYDVSGDRGLKIPIKKDETAGAKLEDNTTTATTGIQI